MSAGIYIIKAILAIFLPPLVAFMERGCNIDFVINIIFTIFGWVPGIIHAWYLLVQDYDKETSSGVLPYDQRDRSSLDTTNTSPSNGNVENKNPSTTATATPSS